MAFPANSPSTAVDAVSRFRNRIIAAGYTPASGLSMQGALYATVANLLDDPVSLGTIGFVAGQSVGGTVTQITSAATAVTLNKVCGQITTVALTTAAAAEEVFTVNNTTVDANDVVCVSTTYAGGGTPIVSVKGVAANAFVIAITNVHASAALDAVLVVNFVVLKSVTT